MVSLYQDRHFQIFEKGPQILERNANIRKKKEIRGVVQWKKYFTAKNWGLD